MTTREAFEEALVGVGVVHDLEAFEENGHLAELFPEVQAIVGFGGSGSGHKDLWWHTKLVVQQCPKGNAMVRWAALFHDVGKVATLSRETGKVAFHGHESLSAKLWTQASKRVEWFTKEERQYIRFIIYNLGQAESYQSDWTDSAVRRFYKLVGDHYADLMSLARADITTKHQHKRQAHHQRMAELSKRVEALRAADAIVPALPKGLGDVLCAELGLEPGKELGGHMKALRAAVEAGELPRQAEPDALVAWVKMRIS